MLSYQERQAIYDIQKQLTEIEETIDKMKKIVDVFDLDAQRVEDLDADVDNVQTQLYVDVNTIREIRRRARPTRLDSDRLETAMADIFNQVRNYKETILPEYQKLVEQLLEKNDEINKKVEEKREKGEKVPNKEETKDALNEAAKKLQKAIDEKPRLQKSIGERTRDFIKHISPYVNPLIEAAKIVLNLLVP
jgi:chromosome segregation ATPase